MIRCLASSSNSYFMIGDQNNSNMNPNDVAWDSTKRVVALWYKGGFTSLIVGLSASNGDGYVQYLPGSGTNGPAPSNGVYFYLGSGTASTGWQRFERNIEADWESVMSSYPWQNTDGIAVTPDSTLDYDIYFDDILLTNNKREQSLFSANEPRKDALLSTKALSPFPKGVR